jgi:two-component system chemotaxis response regulator CheY
LRDTQAWGAIPGDNAMVTSMSALVVDDSQTVRSIVVSRLTSHGFSDTDQAEDGGAALGRLRQRSYDLMISDWEMQPMGGEALLKAVRQDPKCIKMLIIMITGKTSRGNSWLAGANAYLPKPFTESDLQTAIRAVFGTR